MDIRHAVEEVSLSYLYTVHFNRGYREYFRLWTISVYEQEGGEVE